MKIDPNQMARYFAIGVLNSCIAYGVFSLSLWLGIHYVWATLLGGVTAVLAGYKFMKDLVFRRKSRYAFVKFIITFVAMYFINIFIQYILHDILNSYINGAIASLVCALLSYFLNWKFVFGSREASDAQYSD